MKPSQVWVQLGRFGDIINILPVIQEEARVNGQPQHLIVARPYALLLEGTSYALPVIWDGDFADLQGALNRFQGDYHHFRISQVYAHGFHSPMTTDSFIKESYARVGRLHDFGRLPLTFDRRSYQREKELVDRHTHGKPSILVASHGLSSPFFHSHALLELIRNEFGASHEIVDLARVQATRFYDLLGLFDAARALITIDTAHMHLARASNIPTIALVTDGPTPWHATAPLPGQVLRIHYSEFPSRQQEVVSTLKQIIPASWTAAPKVKGAFYGNHKNYSGNSSPTLIHVYSDFQRTGDSLARHNFAKRTWQEQYGKAAWLPFHVEQRTLKRSSRTVFQDTRELPFICDLISAGFAAKSPRSDDILVLTNDDICLVPDTTNQLLTACASHRATWAHRWDFSMLTRPLAQFELKRGSWSCGTDLFAFTRAWWEAHSHKFPDMVLACEAWDWVMRDLMKETQGVESHLLIYHQLHQSFWYDSHNRLHNPGNNWNRALARQFLTLRGTPLAEIGPLPANVPQLVG